MQLPILSTILDQLWPESDPGDSLPPELEIEVEDYDDLPTSWIGTIVWLKIAGRDCRGWIADEDEYSRTHIVLIKPLEGFKVETWRPATDIVAYEWKNIIEVMQTAS